MAETTNRTRSREIPSILKTILAAKSTRLAAARRRVPGIELVRRCRDLPPTLDFRGALETPARGQGAPPTNTAAPTNAAIGTGRPRVPTSGAHPLGGLAIIAELKRRSPSRGVIRQHFEPAAILQAYSRGGAAACSVLTEEDHFGGSLGDLEALRPLAELPLLRKDFIFDSYQIYESRAAGADALLLIVAALADHRLHELIGLSRELDMEALVEVHTAEELDRALACGARIVGINNRDLHSFRVDLGVSIELARSLPAGVTAVSESGIHGPEDIRRLKSVGIRAFLVGEHLMRAEDPAAELLHLREEA
ncbi:MAG: indole-3-glycerol phosphate synthase TrpC [Spirochaetales bacterium]|nr:indole-3-glycerol phosphate synthase TrpC [Spirochaetales bacterium]